MNIRNLLAGLFNYGRARTGIVIAEKFTNWQRPTCSGDLTDAQARYISDAAKCPYCKSGDGLYQGPRGGINVNLFCGNPDCDSRFNVVDPSAGYGFVPWGQFTGSCPEDFIAQRRAEISRETVH